MATKGSVTFDHDLCKGCGLCVEACKVHALEMAENEINVKGYHPVYLAHPEKCNGCQNCAVMCPDVVITVEKEKKVER